MEYGGMTKMSKAEIDTSAPFRSVKEAVMLFGEKVPAHGLYANNPIMMQDGTSENTEETATLISELEETKQSLHEAREDSIRMAQCLSSLQHELEQTKRELHHIKTRHVLDLEIEEDLKFVENSTESIQKVKKETFANSRSMSVAQVAVPPAEAEAVLQRCASMKKKKKKQLIPFIGGIFTKKKGSSEIGLA